MNPDQLDSLPTYPEAHPRRWGIVLPMTLKEIEEHLREGLSGDPQTPRHKAYKTTLEAVHTLAHRGVTNFRGDKVHRILVAAAREHGWLNIRAAYKARPAATQPDRKVCRACMEEKPLAAFRAIATPQQKLKHGWGMDSQRYITSLLCDVCRLRKTRREKHSAARREAPTLIGSFKTSISKALETANKVIKKHTITRRDDTTIIHFDYPQDLEYYTKRQDLIRLARERLNTHIEAGTLLTDIPQAKGLWHELLTPQERAELKMLHLEGSWFSVNRARTPTLWDIPAGRKVQKEALAVDVADEPTTAPPSMSDEDWANL